jgi:hypothetical protein
MTPADRLDVYRQQFWLRHLASLEEDYPTLAWLIGGSDRFRRLSSEFLVADPPRSWDLQLLGAGLPSYVGRQPPWNEDPLAYEGARLDWAFMETFDARDEARVDTAFLARLPEDRLHLATIAFHPSLRTLTLAYPLHEARQAITSGSTPVRPRVEQTHLVVWRDERCWARATSIEAEAFLLLDSLAKGTRLGEACEAIARLHTGQEASALGPRIGAWFQEWTSSGWITSVRLQQEMATVRS